MYNDKVIKVFQDAKNSGVIENANGIGQVGNAECGDIMKMYLLIKDDKIVDAKFQTYGCAAAIASSSVATEMIKGKSLEYALSIKNAQVVEELEGLPPQKIHCSVLAEGSIKAAIEYYQKNKK